MSWSLKRKKRAAVATPLLEARSLIKDFTIGGEVVHAVNDVSLTVARGEFVAIMGASGSGKSTFMNMIGCLDTPSAGQLLLDGIDVGTLSGDELAEIRNRKIGFVFQQFNLLARTSALDNVAVPLIYAGVGASERRERARVKLTELGLGERLLNTPAKLSGGQQQRVAIARALVTEPLVLLADEPTGALDSKTSQDIMAIFQQLNDAGITVIVVTHEADIAEYAKRRIIFSDGRIIEDAPVSQRRGVKL
jgi:putative ABC transport system ATP-binding protein